MAGATAGGVCASDGSCWGKERFSKARDGTLAYTRQHATAFSVFSDPRTPASQGLLTLVSYAERPPKLLPQFKMKFHRIP